MFFYCICYLFQWNSLYYLDWFDCMISRLKVCWVEKYTLWSKLSTNNTFWLGWQRTGLFFRSPPTTSEVSPVNCGQSLHLCSNKKKNEKNHDFTKNENIFSLFFDEYPIRNGPSPPETFHILIGKFSYFVIRFLNQIFFCH